ncbi:genetic competence negative regulator [Neobacillus sp. PS3-12]|jgi:adapter protein MecA 1/2|uniref:genetic competence negative regulator n=1 Tax=Neobacillus sp. PS3-12 TaxID=3070677 RepID=UPI0027E025DC|nr:genetic competence negative regulator [Neobacillus sp. PS3-12]WML53914.1 genetic competence negative regulator [Neobacillus sp. PS3-12]
MRFERLTANKIKIFLTSDDLFDRGLSKDDLWKDSIKWDQLFQDMLKEASEEFNFDFQGAIAIEIFSIQSQGMIMIITVEEVGEGEELLQDGFLEMKVKVEGSSFILYEFESIEEIIELSKRFSQMKLFGGTLYSYNNYYYLLMENFSPLDIDRIIAVLSEYGNVSILSPHVLEEYGIKIINNNAVDTISHFFK